MKFVGGVFVMNSKKKGNTFERKIANLLSQRFAEATGLPKSFRRNPDSGSFFGGGNQKRITTYDTSKACFGDLICPDNFIYAIECKHYAKPPSFASILDGDVSDWNKWIFQAQQDCLNYKKKMAIIIKYNNVKEIVILDELPGSLSSTLTYRDSFVVPLADFLSLSDSFFLMSPNDR